MPVDLNTPIVVTLTAQEWNNVLDVLSDGRFRIVSSLIQKIVEQAQQAQVEQQQPSQRLQSVGGGED